MLYDTSNTQLTGRDILTRPLIKPTRIFGGSPNKGSRLRSVQQHCAQADTLPAGPTDNSYNLPLRRTHKLSSSLDDRGYILSARSFWPETLHTPQKYQTFVLSLRISLLQFYAVFPCIADTATQPVEATKVMFLVGPGLPLQPCRETCFYTTEPTHSTFFCFEILAVSKTQRVTFSKY